MTRPALSLRYAPALASIAILAPLTTAEILIDGNFDDWQGVPLLAGDPMGEADGLEARAVYAQSAGSILFLRFQIGEVRNLQAGSFFDGELDIEILVESEQLPGEFEIVLSHEARSRAFRTGPPGIGPLISQQTLDAAYAPTYASDDFEMILDLAPVGIQPGDTIYFRLTGLPISEPFTLADPATPEPVRSIERTPTTDFRILSYNTLSNGALDPSRQPSFEHIISAFRPDIVLLQEEYSGNATDYTSWLDTFDPLADAQPWNAIKFGDNVIATPYQILPLDSFQSRYSAGIVVLDQTKSLVVINIHAKCCGYTGNSDDNQRIATSELIIETIRRLRDGELGPEFEPHREAPVIVAGDWNLVGSREPLTLIEQSPISNARAITIPQVVGFTTATWRSDRTSPYFLPGRLDLIAADPEVLIPTNVFVADAARLPAPLLSELQLLASDADASDHLPLFVDFDFVPSCPADVDGDRLIGAADYDIFATNFGAGPDATPAQGDANRDGFVNLADFNILGVLFGTPCPD